LGLREPPWVADAFSIVFPLLALCILASALSLVLRYRHSRGEEREQIKLIAFAASLMAILFLVTLVGGSLLAPGTTDATQPLWLKILQNTSVLSYVGVPIAVGCAVLRYRLYDIDILINRTLVYGALTASLALIYLGGVAATEALFRALTGQ
jgi:uncharacterized membrane protein YozB (DUF420 family)